jgi:hypothetical protein
MACAIVVGDNTATTANAAGNTYNGKRNVAAQPYGTFTDLNEDAEDS